MIYIEKRVWNLLKDAPTASTLKIFLYLAINQPDDGICGFRITKEQLALDLNLKKSTIFAALHWLEKNILVQEIKQVADFDFMVNPYLVMNNGDRDARIAEWRRRQRIDTLKEVENSRRRQKKLAKMNNQG